MAKPFVVRSAEVAPFKVSDAYLSKMLIDRHNSGSERMQVNEGIVKAGCKLAGAAHPEPYDELYIVVKGQASLDMDGDNYDIGPGSVVFIPWGTFHALENKSETEDFVLLTIWPQTPEKGGNEVYDMRLEAWGTSFKLVSEIPAEE